MTSGEKCGTLSGAGDPLLVSDGVLWPSYDDLGEKWGTLSGARDPLLVSDGVLWLSFDDLGGKSGEHLAELRTPSLYQKV